MPPVIHQSPYPYPSIRDALLGDYVLENAERNGDRPALVDAETGSVTTYAEFVTRVDAVAAGLARSVAPGDVVALLSHNQPAWAVAFHAVVAAGAAVLPMNPAFTVEEMARQLQLSRARAAICASGVAPTVRKAATAAGIGNVFTLGDVAGMPSLENDVSVLGGRRPELDLDPTVAIAVLPFSSGTTGVPKAVKLTHRNIVANIEQHRPVWQLGPDDVFCAALPLFHIYGMTIVMNAALRAGARVITMPRFDLDRFIATVRDHQVTKLHLVPPVVAALASYPEIDTAVFSSVRTAVSGAAPLDPAAAERAEERFGITIRQGYGMTEASPGVTYVPEDRVDESPPDSIGVLVSGTQARVVDPVSGDDTDGAGELWVHGPQVMAGYLGDRDATRAVLTADGWLRTGDLVRVNSDGWWWLVGRLKELIKCKGYQVAPAELETLLLTHPSVADAAVVGIPDAKAGEIPAAWIVPAGDIDADDLMSWMAGRVAPYKKVRVVQFIDAIPRSPAGKILRRELRILP